MSIADKITRLQTAKEDIAEAIVAKGGAVASGDGFEEFSADIAGIPEGLQVEENYTVSEGKLTSASVELDEDVVAHIPDGVTSLGGGAFFDNMQITKVVMPNSVVTIEDGLPWTDDKGCFNSCEYLQEIVLSSVLSKIGSFAFYGCKRLTSFVIPNTVTEIGRNAFVSCLGLTSIVIPDSVTIIKESAFSNCHNLISVTIGATEIETSVFNDCINLISIVIGDSVTIIEERAFYNCPSLTDIYYTGTQAQWEQITIGTDAIPASATIHYEYTPE